MKYADADTGADFKNRFYVQLSGNRLASFFLNKEGLWITGGVQVESSESSNDNTSSPTITTQPQARNVWQGENATFSATATGQGVLSYQWAFNGKAIKGATGSSYTIAKTTAKNAGNYTVTITNANGSVTSAAATLTVNVPQKPKITQKPVAKVETGLGKSVTFTVAASGNPPPTFQWMKDGQPIPGATSATLTIANVTEGNLGKYTCVITSGPNKVTSSATTLSAILPPQIETPPPPAGDITYALAAKGAKLSVKVAKNKAKPTYLWLLDGEPAPGANNKATYTAKADGVYSVRVTNAAGTVEKKIADIRLITPPKVASITASKTSIVAGEPVTFTATLQGGTGTPPLTWKWMLGKTVLATHTTTAATDTFTAAAITAAGKYSVEVTNGAGKVVGKAKSKAVAIKVVIPAAITSQPVGVTLVEGKAVKLTVKATGTAKLTYQWYQIGSDGKTVALAGATKATLSLKAAKGTSVASLAGKYWVVVDNPANRPVKSNIVTLAASAAPAAAGINTLSANSLIAATLAKPELAPATLPVGASLSFEGIMLTPGGSDTSSLGSDDADTDDDGIREVSATWVADGTDTDRTCTWTRTGPDTATLAYTLINDTLAIGGDIATSEEHGFVVLAFTSQTGGTWTVTGDFEDELADGMPDAGEFTGSGVFTYREP
ncbi:hypothetical protein OPIT5_23595 [Opitutaceae bacterium TAV5]|nr:hypothetical protein OPIT5_23595 [Opitutaceae bacterium TAV5]